ncbi:MAG TPA: MFS transporter [Polyangiaceae bacterium]|jgi:acyl-[acyl-carrier-protein]-phospholipid O-acyltransferase/long-chain-fatty-acid--[acyl-carrier-protein] ligase|nr:MAG: Lysophospholipid transporter LplT [Deltaproteobacteria bacterium ADurb.Bin207]HNS97096.1 MFS transporter [Polyangiaceae bacterium]HNZ21142.1 MFS transporter [Polyangiaceae bacterium]HOD24551.1 MFS transporter [Polyangiaceae bacterium]HOE47912.1 MFS transporter [Polyangiaceae bacterium]
MSNHDITESPLRANRSFQGHVATQFFGAFNDNLFKQLILFLAARELFPGQDKQGIAFAVFSLPFVLFSGVAGDLSERFSKRTIIVLMKVAEIGIMLAGAVALQQRAWTAMLVVLFIMGAQSAFFGPSKYGIIPELVGKQRLLSANGIISMTTFLSILLGQAAAGPLLDRYGQQLWITGAWCVGVAVVGTGVALLIRPLPALRPTMPIRKNPFGSVIDGFRQLRSDPRVIHVLLLNSLFWFNGGVVQQALVGIGAPAYLDIPLDQNWRLSLLLVSLATSIIVGSVCVPIVAKAIRPGKLIAFGAVAMLVCQASLTVSISAWGPQAYSTCVVLVAILGFTGAFFAVPVQTFLQDAPEQGTRGITFAVNNFLNFSFIFLAGAFYLTSAKIQLSPGFAATLAAVAMCSVLWVVRKSVLGIERPNATSTP